MHGVVERAVTLHDGPTGVVPGDNESRRIPTGRSRDTAFRPRPGGLARRLFRHRVLLAEFDCFASRAALSTIGSPDHAKVTRLAIRLSIIDCVSLYLNHLYLLSSPVDMKEPMENEALVASQTVAWPYAQT